MEDLKKKKKLVVYCVLSSWQKKIQSVIDQWLPHRLNRRIFITTETILKILRNFKDQQFACKQAQMQMCSIEKGRWKDGDLLHHYTWKNSNNRIHLEKKKAFSNRHLLHRRCLFCQQGFLLECDDCLHNLKSTRRHVIRVWLILAVE